MAKLTLQDVGSGYQSPTVINANNEAIEEAMEKTLSRDGTGPNQMEANLDMNSKRILNLPDPVNSREPVTLGILTAYGDDVGAAALRADLASEEEGLGVDLVSGAFPAGTPDMFGAAGDGVTDDTTALQEWLDACSDRGWIALCINGTFASESLTVPDGLIVHGPLSGTAVFEQITSSGTFFTMGDGSMMIAPRRLSIKIDGGDTDDSYRTDVATGHVGIYSKYTDSATFTDNIVIDGVEVCNFEEVGIQMRNVNNDVIRRCKVYRCGYAGIASWNGFNTRIFDNEVDNIYPGIGGNAPYLNAYGIVCATWTTPTDRNPEGVVIANNQVSNITSWTGIDIHNGTDCVIRENFVTLCQQGIAYECHAAGLSSARMRIIDNVVTNTGSTGVTTRSGQNYSRSCGIIANGGPETESPGNLIISGNFVQNHGSADTNGRGAIQARNWRSIQITNNTIDSAYSIGIRLNGSGTAEVLFGVVSNNIVDGVIETNSTQYGVYLESRVLVTVRNNYIHMTDGTAFEQTATPDFTSEFINNHLYSPSGSTAVLGYQPVPFVAKTDTWSESVDAGAESGDITGLEVTVNPTSISDVFLIRAVLNVGCASAAQATLYENDVAVASATGAAASSRERVTSATSLAGDSLAMSQIVIEFLRAASASSSLTYSIRLSHGGGVTRTIYLNRSPSDTDAAGTPRTMSYLSVQKLTG